MTARRLTKDQRQVLKWVLWQCNARADEYRQHKVEALKSDCMTPAAEYHQRIKAYNDLATAVNMVLRGQWTAPVAAQFRRHK